jgi:molybdenum cofactor guanylyltransferase
MNPAVSTVILAGGLGTRIGGDKALQLLQDRPLLDWVLETVRPQSDEVLVSANRNPGAYVRYGCRVVPDRMADYAGPLAGLQAAMMQARYEWVASVPCDAPFLPRDLIARLHVAIHGGAAEAGVAMAGGKRQPAVALYHRSVLPMLNDFLAGGGRKVMTWQDSLQLMEVPFDDAADFINLNSAQELALASQMLQEGRTHDDIRRAIA